ncbi:S8 family serine peptidase [Halomarina oriensis]|uniref:S8 family serine peptidase n=2 Tax=Halomarina oriensis TaxID=671145 RepID=A0A6B0GN06_9EURY|nr:S8 family serine peptidase [Halomarina oriensis]
MTRRDEDSSQTELTRRTFVRTTGLLAGAGVLGAGASGRGAATTALDDDFLNFRAQEAQKVWDRGYRGRTDRTIALTDSGLEARHPDLGPWNGIQALVENGEVTLRRPDEGTAADESEVFADVEGTPTADTPKTVGWYDPGTRYGDYDRPRDPNGHGTHCTSIMGGSGRASAVDESTVQQERPRTALAAVVGNVLGYEVEAEAGTGVFASAYGEAIELRIEGPDGETLDSTAIDSDASTTDNVVVEAPAEQTGTYTVYAQAAGNTALSAAFLERIAVGAFLDPDSTAADRTGEASGLHTGVAPDHSLVCLQGLSTPTNDLGANAEEFARIFNMRAVNMSWGYVGGLPLGAAGGTLGDIPASIKEIAQAGVLTCAAAGNAATPANGNGAPGIADECLSVVATGPLDGISAYSSGGIGGLDEDADFRSPEPDDAYMKPDVTAPGGYVTDSIIAALTGQPDTPESEQPPIREYTRKAGTSMAAPFTTGVAGLVAQAMEEDAPSSLSLPAPADAGLEDVYRLKQAILATASETVFTAAPYHRVKAPTYDFGGRDPYEGFGRVNPSAAVDATTRELSGTSEETVGLNLPEDERAVAGYVQAGPGTVTAEVSFAGYSGGEKGQAVENPHVDLFVYDAETPAQFGEPNILGRAQGLDGNATVEVSLGRESETKTLYVVAKLVNVPGAVNGTDVQARLDLTTSVEDGFFVDGTREDDGSVFTGGQTNQVDITVDPSEKCRTRDVVPSEWTVLAEQSDDVKRVEEADGVQYVYFRKKAKADTDTTYSYFVEAPDGLTFSGAYTFGPAEVDPGSGWVGVAGTSDTNVVEGQNTNV